jgi:outer membrane protein OmpA-like peptidoglycan-associated protein
MKLKLFAVFSLILFFLAGCSYYEEAMVQAIKNDEATKVHSLLDKGVSPNLKKGHGVSFLMLVAYLGYNDIAKLLIERGADVNAKDHDGNTALIYATKNGNIATVKLLLENGIDIDTVNNEGKTALLIAREGRQIQIVEYLNSWGKMVSNPTGTPISTPTPEPIEVTKTVAAPAPIPTPIVMLNVTPVPDNSPAPVMKNNKALASIYFSFNQSSLRSDQIGKMKDILATLNDNLTMYIILGGHSDEKGNLKYSFVLSAQRAETIKKYLLNAGIVQDKIIVYSYGKEHPIKYGHDEASQSLNRRVDVLMWETPLSSEEMLKNALLLGQFPDQSHH